MTRLLAREFLSDLLNIAFMSLLFFALVLMASCKRSADPTPSPKASAPLICNVSGLGGTATTSQIDDLVAMERASFLNAQVAYFGPLNGWMANIPAYCTSSKYDRLVLLGHSFGGDTVARAAAVLPVDLLILVDPVCHETGVDTITIPATVKRCVVFRRKYEGLGFIGIERRANISGKAEIVIIDAGHNQVPHDPVVVAAIQDAIRGVVE